MLSAIVASQSVLDMLVEENLITSDAAERIHAKVREAWIPIGEILWKQGHLTRTDLTELLKMQASEPHLRIGEIAVREGLCTERDILKAVQRQRESSPHQLDFLSSELTGESERLCAVLIRYIRQLEACLADLPARR